MHVVLFDIDGTLISSLGVGIATMNLVLHEEFNIGEPIISGNIAGHTDRSIARNHFLSQGVEDSPENFQRFIAGYLRRLPEMLTRRGGRLLPGVGELLELLSRRSDIRIGLLTGNVADGARLKLAHFGIATYFTFGAFGDGKLDRNGVAQDALVVVREHVDPNMEPHRILVVGDTPLDVSCARSIGAKACAVATGTFTLDELRNTEPDLLLADLSSPAELLAMCQIE